MLRKGMFLADRYEIIEQIGTGGMLPRFSENVIVPSSLVSMMKSGVICCMFLPSEQGFLVAPAHLVFMLPVGVNHVGE